MSLVVVQTEEQRRVEQGLPGYMLALGFTSMRQTMNLSVRADLEELANKASIAPLQGLDTFMQMRLAKVMESDGYRILRAANQDHLPTMIGGLCRMLVRMADRGVKVEQNALLVALAIVAEIDDGEDSWGRVTSINAAMVKIENEARRAGYFVGTSTMH